MEAPLCLLGDGSSSGGGGGNTKNDSNRMSCYNADAESKIELGLGLSLGSGSGGGRANKSSGARGDYGRILTAKDFPSYAYGFKSPSSPTITSAASGFVSAKRRPTGSISQEGASATVSQVVGWPPVRAYRMNSLVNQSKASTTEEDKLVNDNNRNKDTVKEKMQESGKKATDDTAKEKGHFGFVKVTMDRVAIGRKIDLNAHACYETLAQAVENMFFRSTTSITSIRSGGEKEHGMLVEPTKTSKLLDGSSEFALTYEDKEGDWMLVGDVPWGMFLSTVKRLRIMRTLEANGLAPGFQQRSTKQTIKPF